MSEERAEHEPHVRCLHKSASVVICAWRCDGRDRAHASEEASDAHTIVLVRRGAFVRHVRGVDAVADASSALFFERDDPYRVRHPAGDDACTSFTLREDLLFEVLAASDLEAHERRERLFSDVRAPCSARSQLLHQKLVQRLALDRADDCFADEIALTLCAALVRPLARRAVSARGPARRSTSDDHRDRVEASRVLLQQRLRERVRLDEIAHGVHCSSFHFARMFRRETGSTVHRYLQRLRLQAALASMIEGVHDLTELALGLGYSDHSHFTHAFRREFGLTPSKARATMADRELRELSRNLQV